MLLFQAIQPSPGIAVVTMPRVRVMQPAIDEVIDVVAVRHLLVAAIVVLAFAINWRTDRRVRRAHRDSPCHRDGCTYHFPGNDEFRSRVPRVNFAPWKSALNE